MKIYTLLIIFAISSTSAFLEASPLETTTSQSIKKTKLLFEGVVNASWRYHYKSQVIIFNLKRSGKLGKGNIWGDARWRAISPNEIIIKHPNGAKMVMTFDESFQRFHGKDWDGTAVSGTRVTKEK